jgi:hypothetical protein
MSPAIASATYRSSRAVSTAQPSAVTVVHDSRVERKMLVFVATDSREASYREALKALVDCQPVADRPTEMDLKAKGVRIRF